MKKILAMVLALMMLVACGAVAESAHPVVDFDAASFEGMDGVFVGIEDIQMMFWCPYFMHYAELTEEMIAEGTLAYLCNEDDSWRMSVGVAAVADEAGNAITDLDALVALYQSIEGAEVAALTLNGLDCVMCSIPALDTLSVCYMTVDGQVLTFNFAPRSDEIFGLIASLMSISIMPMVVEEAA